VDAALEMLTGEVGRLTERVAQQEERVAKAEERLERAEKSAAFSSPQMEEISKILSLVEKSEQRDDYKRAIRMIDELRGNILDLHTQIKQVQTYPDPLPPHLTETLTEMVATAISSGEAEIRRRVEADMAEMKERAAGLEREWEEWRKGEGVVDEVGETRRFEGRMTTLQYE
jgi:adenylate kinase